MVIDESKVVWDDAPQIDETKVKWDAPEQTKNYTLWEAIKSGASKAPSDVLNMFKALGHPAQAAEGLNALLTGYSKAPEAVETPQQTAQREAIRDKFIGEKKDVYGNLITGNPQPFYNYIANQPVSGLVSDALLPLSAAGGYFPAAAKAASFMDPVSLATKALRPVAAPIGNAAAGLMGMTTGKGGLAVQEAYRGTPEFVQAFRGKVEPEAILNETKQALNKVRSERGATYQADMAPIVQSRQLLDLDPVKQSFENLLKDYKVKRTADGFDFHDSPLLGDPTAVNDVVKLAKIVDERGNLPITPNMSLPEKYQVMMQNLNDRKPVGMDAFKRQIDNFYSDSSQVRQMVSQLRGEVKDSIVSQIPEYAGAMKNYELATDFLNQFDKALSTGNKASIDTALRKMNQAMRENFEFRRTLLQELDQKTGGNLVAKIAGNQMDSWRPMGLIGQGLDVSAIIGALAYGNPKLLIGVGMATPKVVGEFALELGRAVRGAQGNGLMGPIPRATMYETSQTIKNPH